MDLGRLNKEYWSKYNAGSTPGVEEIPALSFLERFSEGSNVLDIGTGTGTLAEYLAGLGFTVYGIDINDNEIASNTSRETNVAYSLQDITEGTNFRDSFFDLVIFRYTLTSVHKPQWHALAREIGRITKLGGYVWLAEPHVSNAYSKRYELGRQQLGDEHALYVFKDKELASHIEDTAALNKALADNQVSRIVRHYDEVELKNLFPQFEALDTKHVNHTSPSGYPLDTVVITLKKTS